MNLKSIIIYNSIYRYKKYLRKKKERKESCIEFLLPSNTTSILDQVEQHRYKIQDYIRYILNDTKDILLNINLSNNLCI